jgi:thioredoxin reductase (NADPH)
MDVPTATRTPEFGPSDPYARGAQTFPQLSPELVARVAAYGAEERLEKGTLIFELGQRGVDFFLVLEGRVEIFELDDYGEPNVFTVHGERQFTGELDLFNDRQILVSGRAGTDSRVIRVKRAEFRRLVIAEPDIGEIIMRAFILRRVGLILHGQASVVVIGPGHGSDTLRLQRFLTRNAYPLRLLDTDIDPTGDGFVTCLDLTPDDLPVVVAPGERVLRNPTNAALADKLGLTERIEAGRVYDVAVVGGGPAGLAAAVYAASEGSTPSCSKAWRRAVRPGRRPRSRTISDSPPAFPDRRSPDAPRSRPRSSAHVLRSRVWSSASTARGCLTSCASMTASRLPPARWWWRQAPATASSTCPITTGSKVRASITPPPPWRRSSVPTRI